MDISERFIRGGILIGMPSVVIGLLAAFGVLPFALAPYALIFGAMGACAVVIGITINLWVDLRL